MCNESLKKGTGKVFQIGTVRYNWSMSAHASQAFSIAHCTDSEDLPGTAGWMPSSRVLLADIVEVKARLAPPGSITMYND